MSSSDVYTIVSKISDQLEEIKSGIEGKKKRWGFPSPPSSPKGSPRIMKKSATSDLTDLRLLARGSITPVSGPLSDRSGYSPKAVPESLILSVESDETSSDEIFPTEITGTGTALAGLLDKLGQYSSGKIWGIEVPDSAPLLRISDRITLIYMLNHLGSVKIRIRSFDSNQNIDQYELEQNRRRC